VARREVQVDGTARPCKVSSQDHDWKACQSVRPEPIPVVIAVHVVVPDGPRRRRSWSRCGEIGLTCVLSIRGVVAEAGLREGLLGRYRRRLGPGARRVDAVQRLARDRTQAGLIEDGNLEFVTDGKSGFGELLVDGLRGAVRSRRRY